MPWPFTTWARLFVVRGISDRDVELHEHAQSTRDGRLHRARTRRLLRSCTSTVLIDATTNARHHIAADRDSATAGGHRFDT